MADIQTIQIEIKKSKTGWIRKLFFFPAAVFGFLMGLVLCVTIIGIIPGFFMITGSVGLFVAGLNYQQVTCPHCKKQKYVVSQAEDFKCTRCNNATIIEWEKPNP
ncbi:hypothetical protein P8881_16920 [Bacillus haynesii]|nr:hypothetical protein [Bacillus haynesii]MEC0739162.1 hypothetical protein [Bacillus haynesii]